MSDTKHLPSPLHSVRHFNTLFRCRRHRFLTKDRIAVFSQRSDNDCVHLIVYSDKDSIDECGSICSQGRFRRSEKSIERVKDHFRWDPMRCDHEGTGLGPWLSDSDDLAFVGVLERISCICLQKSDISERDDWLFDISTIPPNSFRKKLTVPRWPAPIMANVMGRDVATGIVWQF